MTIDQDVCQASITDRNDEHRVLSCTRPRGHDGAHSCFDATWTTNPGELSRGLESDALREAVRFAEDYGYNRWQQARSGQRTEAKRHRRLGGTGTTPRDELANSYSINITTEDKGGKQIPASIRDFVCSKWAKDALYQVNKKVPVGSDALPFLWLDMGRDGTWVIGRVPERGLR